MPNYDEDGLPIEEFIQALTSQLDRAQVMMAVKARVGLPLTFAVKDITIDLRAHVNMIKNRVLIRPAGPGDAEASVIHLALTTITRPMIEENTLQLEPDEPSLNTVLGDSLEEDDKRRLEWAGIHSVSQLRELQRVGGETVIEQVAQIPAMRLRQALQRASQPRIDAVLPGADGALRVRGFSLTHDGTTAPQVWIGKTPAQVVSATDREVVIMPGHAPETGISEAFALSTETSLILETTQGVTAEFPLSTAALPMANEQLSEDMSEVDLAPAETTQAAVSTPSPQITAPRWFKSKNGDKGNA
ncbi:MAG: hypothetical protein KF716_30480 [Anaerolineae bacterium]|nr:hypothetical protein [Anaerolineae bacterium]